MEQALQRVQRVLMMVMVVVKEEHQERDLEVNLVVKKVIVIKMMSGTYV
jgi:hypothetical protein